MASLTTTFTSTASLMSFTSSAVSSISSDSESEESESPKRSLSPMEIGVVIGSVAIALLILLALVFVMALRRPRHKPHKYQHPENGSPGSVDAIELPSETHASKPFKDNLHSMFTRAEAEPLIITETEQRHPYSQPQYLKDAYTRPSSVKHYQDLAKHETHFISLDSALSPKNNLRFETAAPSSSKSIKFAPISIPKKTLNLSNGERSTKRAVSTRSTRSSKFPDSGWDSDDSASIYSMASAFSSLQTGKTPPGPVPPVPIHIASSTQSSPPKGTDVITYVRDGEGTITKSLSPPFLSRPSIRIKGDNGEEIEVDESQIYNVAKLLHSRQSSLPIDAPSRNSSVVSHIERTGSIKPIIFLPTDEDSNRPHLKHMKHLKHLQQKSTSKRGSRVSSSPLSPTYSPDSLSTSPPSHPLAQTSQVIS